MKILIALIILSCSHSQAGIFLEPYVGYYLGETDVKGPSSNVANDDSGMAYGARLGFTVGGYLYVAGDATLIKGEYENSSSNTTDDLEVLSYAAVAGIRFGMFHVWYGHAFKVESETMDEGVATDYEGTGWKAGIGTRLFGKINLNLEYLTSEMDTVDGADIPTSSINSVESTGYMLTLGFPLSY